jgi:hypothetical protein
MAYFAGLWSVKETSISIVDDTGKIVREARVASEPEALLQVLTNTIYRFKRIELEAGPLSQWLYSVLSEAGLPPPAQRSGDDERSPVRCRSRSGRRPTRASELAVHSPTSRLSYNQTMGGLIQLANWISIMDGHPNRESSRLCHAHASTRSTRASTCARLVEATHPPAPARMKAAMAKKLILRIESSYAFKFSSRAYAVPFTGITLRRPLRLRCDGHHEMVDFKLRKNRSGVLLFH